jgi:hypothetical protein
MFKQIFQWCTGRLESATRENQHKIAVAQRAAHAMIFYLYGLPIRTIDATNSENICLMRPPTDIDELTQFERPLPLALAAEHAMLITGDELLHGRQFLGNGYPTAA